MIIFSLFQKIIFLLSFLKIESLLNENNTINSPNIAVIPFKTFYPPINQNGNKPFGAKDYYNSIHYSSSYLEIETGKNDNNQKLNLFFILDDYSIDLDDNYFKEEKIQNLICNYSSNFSDSYEIDKTKNIHVANKAYSVYSREYFKIFSDINLVKHNKIKFNFFHSIDKIKNISYTCGKAGLLYASKELFGSYSEINLINQIHNNLSNVDVSWTFKFNLNNDKYEGLFIMGIESLEKKENKNILIPIYTKLTGHGNILEWKFTIDELFIGNQIYEINDEEIKIDSNIEGFEVPKLFSEKLNEIFFNKYYSQKICENEIVTKSHKVISCYSDKFTENDLKNFPEINFYKFKIGYNFTFTWNDLFYKRDKKYFFKMINNIENKDIDFKVGRIFLKKYQVIFNSDAKSMSFYKNNNHKNILYENKYINNKNIFLSVLSYIFIGILFLGLGIFFGRKYCFINKKRYANELEDDNYVYKSKKDGIKKEQKLIEMS